MLFNARKAVIQDDRADYPRHGNYEYPAQQQAKKPLPGKKRSGGIPLALILVIIAGIVCIYFYANMNAFGFKATATPSLSVATNTGMPPVFHAPSLSAKQVDRVLCTAHSTACGTGGALYSGSLKSGVDDLFLMGVFDAESQDGTLGAAIANHSVGNLVSNGVLIHYATWQASYADFYGKVKASDEQSPQSVLDYLYIPGITNVLALKKARSVEPDLNLVLSTEHKLAGE
jgi:hypothetical protein